MTRFNTAFLALTLTACSLDGDPEPDFEGGCDVASRVAIDDLDAPLEDFIPSEVLAAALGQFSGDLMRDGATIDSLAIGLSQDGDPEWVDYVPAGNPDGIEIGTVCRPAMEVLLELTLDSGDLSETIPITLVVTSASEIAFFADTDGLTLNGAAEPLTLDLDELDALRFQVSATLTDGSWEGEVVFMGTTSEGTGDDGVASATVDPWADLLVSR